jgi:hypothetical protein
VQPPKISVIEKTADHVRRDLLGADRVKLVPRHELETHGRRRPAKPSGEHGGGHGLDHDHAGSTATRMAVSQPEEGHGLSVAGWPGGLALAAPIVRERLSRQAASGQCFGHSPFDWELPAAIKVG